MGISTDRSEPRNRKYDHHDDDQGIDQRLQNLADGIVDVVGGIVGKTAVSRPLGQVLFDQRPSLLRTRLITSMVLALGSGKNPHEDSGLT